MDRKRSGYWLGAALAVVLVTQEASAQAPPGGGMNMPSREQIAEKVKQVLDASPEEVIEIAGVVKITYKKIPTDPQRVAELLGQQMGQQLPPGVDIEQALRMYGPQITELLNQSLADFGKLEAKVELKIKSKRIPVGEYKIGMLFEGERPLALIVSGEGLRRPIDIRLKTRGVDLQPEMKMEIKTPDNMVAGEEKFDLQLDFMRFQAKSKSKLERAAPGAPAEAEDDEPAEAPAGDGGK